MTTSSPVISQDTHLVGPDTPFVFESAPGHRFVMRSKDASGNQIREGVVQDDLDRDRLFPVAGPVNVTGVRAGDFIGVEIHSIVADPRGHTWTRPGLGFGSETEFHVRSLDSVNPVIEWGPGPDIPVPSQLHVGTVGVLPEIEQLPRTLGTYGGNLDFVGTGAGSTVWLRAQVDGAGIFLGDVHAAMGDAEVCGTGVEVAASSELTVHRARGWQPGLPVISTGGRFWLLGVGDSIEEALETALRLCVDRFAETQSMSAADAYLAVGLLLEVKICQVVNPRRSVAVSLASGLDRIFAMEAYE